MENIAKFVSEIIAFNLKRLDNMINYYENGLDLTNNTRI